jgi:hypothetical protein
VPLFRRHTGECGVIVEARVVHEYLYGSLFEKALESGTRRRGVGHIEHDGVSVAARVHDLIDDGICSRLTSIRVYIDEVARSSQCLADGGA